MRSHVPSGLPSFERSESCRMCARAPQRRSRDSDQFDDVQMAHLHDQRWPHWPYFFYSALALSMPLAELLMPALEMDSPSTSVSHSFSPRALRFFFAQVFFICGGFEAALECCNHSQDHLLSEAPPSRSSCVMFFVHEYFSALLRLFCHVLLSTGSFPVLRGGALAPRGRYKAALHSICGAPSNSEGDHRTDAHLRRLPDSTVQPYANCRVHAR